MVPLALLAGGCCEGSVTSVGLVTLPIECGRTYAGFMESMDSPHADDTVLARRIIAAAPARDAGAEAELCQRLGPRIRLYGLRHLRDAQAAADLTQDVLVLTLQ